MGKRYQIHLFGKTGCSHCQELRDCLEGLRKDPRYADFELVFHDLDTEVGLVDFCEAECLNPLRIPSFYLSKRDERTGEMRPVPNPIPGDVSQPGGDGALYSWIGLQSTSSAGFSAALLAATLDRALA